MENFKLDNKTKTVLFGLLGLGVVCLLLTFFGDDELHTRFWSNYLHNTVFFTGIAFISLFTIAAFMTAYSGWHTVVKRIWEAYSLFLVVGLVLMIPLFAGVYGHFHHLYHWAAEGVTDPTSSHYDALLDGKSSFLNSGWYTFGTIIIVGFWIFIAFKLRSFSIDEDQQGDAQFAYHRKMRFWAALFLPLAAFSSAAMIWQWVMSIDAHWYSTMFAWYSTASWFVAAMALTILTIIFLKSKGFLDTVTTEHLHDLGKYVFAISIFWAYLWFSQYMLIWYANVGEETWYFKHRMDNYPALFYGNLILNFVLPFFILMRNSTKRKYGSLAFVAILVLFGHWIDFFLMIKPGAWINAHDAIGGIDPGTVFRSGFTIPGLLEIGTFIGFLAGFTLFFMTRLEKASLTPANDPYLEESLHHHV